MPFKNPHPLYNVWRSMRGRCLNQHARSFPNYGGRGISICPEWDSFAQFVSDMGERPPGTSIDRIDNDGNYTPENCRWASKRVQQRNRRNAVYVLVEGVRYRAIELAEQAGFKADTIIARAAKGMTLEQVMSPEEYTNKTAWEKAVAARVANQRAATHCRNGHAWTAENTKITPQGWKRCRTCHREKMRRYTAEKRLSLACDEI